MGLFDGFSKSGEKFSDLRKYVGDYEIIEVRDARGKVRKEARYTGPWMVMRDSGSAVRLRLLLTAVMAGLLALAYLRMLFLVHLVSGQMLVMLPILVGLFPTLYLLMGAAHLPFRGKPMRRDQYMHSFIRVCRSAAAVGICMLVGQIAALIFRTVRGDWLYLGEDWKFTAYGVFVLVGALGMIGMIQSIEVTEKPNSAYRA